MKYRENRKLCMIYMYVCIYLIYLQRIYIFSVVLDVQYIFVMN